MLRQLQKCLDDQALRAAQTRQAKAFEYMFITCIQEQLENVGTKVLMESGDLPPNLVLLQKNAKVLSKICLV